MWYKSLCVLLCAPTHRKNDKSNRCEEKNTVDWLLKAFSMETFFAVDMMNVKPKSRHIFDIWMEGVGSRGWNSKQSKTKQKREDSNRFGVPPSLRVWCCVSTMNSQAQRLCIQMHPMMKRKAILKRGEIKIDFNLLLRSSPICPHSNARHGHLSQSLTLRRFWLFLFIQCDLFIYAAAAAAMHSCCFAALLVHFFSCAFFDRLTYFVTSVTWSDKRSEWRKASCVKTKWKKNEEANDEKKQPETRKALEKATPKLKRCCSDDLRKVPRVYIHTRCTQFFPSSLYRKEPTALF